MPIKLPGRYEPGSAKARAHRLLTDGEIAVDCVYGVEPVQPGMEAITFTAGGKARTAFATADTVIRVVDGWDVPVPETTWRPAH